MSSFYESPQYNIYLCQICESNSHYGYECSQRVPLVYEPEPCYVQSFSDNDYSHDLPSVDPLINHHCCYECGNSLNDFFCPDCTCEFCGNGAHVGYNCLVQVPFLQTLPSFPQQYPCCEDYGVIHEPYQCQPKNHDYYDEQNSCYDSNSFGFDQIQTPQYTVNHPIFNAHNDLLNLIKQMTSMCEMVDQLIQKKQEEKRIQEDQAANTRYWKIPAYYDDDDNEEESNSLKDNNISELPPYSAVTPNEPVNSLIMGDKHLDTVPATESNEFIKSSVENPVPNPITPTEPIDSLSMGDKHLDTILETKSDEFIKSRVENLVPNPSESEGENGCDVPAGFTTFSNVLFDDDYDSDSSDDQSLFVEDVREKICSNPLFDEEIIPMEIDPHSFIVESDIIESLPNHDSSIIISLKIDSLFDEFVGELTLLKSFPPGIDKIDCHPEKEIRLTKRLLYDNSSPRPPEEIVFDNSHADIESFSPSPIPNKDRDPLMEEIDLSINPDDQMPPGIEEDNDDSERDILILE
nr:hypothetical protein [Tanacetum cinerariifolium]